MAVDRKWIERNLGFDPVATPPPDTTFAFARAAKAPTTEDLEREVIDFDSESPAGLQFMAFTTATGLSRYTDVPWPKGLAPKTGRAPGRSSNSPLPRADVLPCRRRSRAEPRTHPRQGFPKRLPLLHP